MVTPAKKANNSMSTPNSDVAVANPIVLDVEVLKQFIDHFRDIRGNKYPMLSDHCRHPVSKWYVGKFMGSVE
jgi:hypothetical protein